MNLSILTGPKINRAALIFFVDSKHMPLYVLASLWEGWQFLLINIVVFLWDKNDRVYSNLRYTTIDFLPECLYSRPEKFCNLAHPIQI